MKRFVAAVLAIALVPGTVYAKKPTPSDYNPGQLILVDANGKMVGDAFQTENNYSVVYFQVDEQLYSTSLNNIGDKQDFLGSPFDYEGAGCTGNAYMRQSTEYLGEIFLSPQVDNILYRSADTPEPVVTVYSYGWAKNGEIDCRDLQAPRIDYDRLYKPVPVIDLNEYTKPYKIKLIR